MWAGDLGRFASRRLLKTRPESASIPPPSRSSVEEGPVGRNAVTLEVPEVPEDSDACLEFGQGVSAWSTVSPVSPHASHLCTMTWHAQPFISE